MDGIIDIIIAVLFIAIPTVFKAISNRLEKSGKVEKAKKFKKITDVFEDEGEGSTIEGWLMGRMDSEKEDDADEPMIHEPAPEVVMGPEAPVAVKPVFFEEGGPQLSTIKRPEAIKSASRKPMMSIEDEPKIKGEKIDPKKLVIYSEIMKPKF